MSSDRLTSLLYRIDGNKEQKSCLWSNENISFGVSKNKAIENMIKSNGLTIFNKICDEAFYEKSRIVLPLKTRFAHSSHYYHIILHEYAHFKAATLNQDAAYQTAYKEYFVKFNHFPDTDNLFAQIASKDDFLNSDKAVQNVLRAYFHEEAKCEVAAFQVMEHAKLQITEQNHRHVMATFNTANKILSIDGRDLISEFKNQDSQISKELKILSDSMCKDYDMAKERIRVKERERER